MQAGREAPAKPEPNGRAKGPPKPIVPRPERIDRDKLQPSEAGLAYKGGGHDRDHPQDFAARMREAWALRDAGSDIGDQRSAIREDISDRTAAPQSLANRLRAGSTALDHDEIAARLAALRQGREVEKEQVAQEVERLRAKELKQEHEAEVRRERGPGHEL